MSSDDPVARDALALMACELGGDEEGAATILADCDLREVAKCLTEIAAEYPKSGRRLEYGFLDFRLGSRRLR